MHTYRAANGTVIHHNSDLSDDVEILSGGNNLTVNGDDLLEFFTEYLKSRLMERVEGMVLADLLTLYSGVFEKTETVTK